MYLYGQLEFYKYLDLLAGNGLGLGLVLRLGICLGLR